jgi:hypothetical protein
MQRLVPCVITHVRPVRWLHDGTGVVDRYVNPTSRFSALRNSASSIPTTGEVRLHRHGLDALVKHRINRLTCSLVGMEVVHRYNRALLAQSKSTFLADAAS